MRRRLWVSIFFASLVWAEEIDAEILKDLDFFSQMDAVENLEIAEKLEEPEMAQDLEESVGPGTSSTTAEGE